MNGGGHVNFTKYVRYTFTQLMDMEKIADNPTTLNMIACYRQKQTKLFIIEPEVTSLKV